MATINLLDLQRKLTKDQDVHLCNGQSRLDTAPLEGIGLLGLYETAQAY